MQTHKLIPGTPEWHAHRAQHFNASDAPAMLGCSPYTTRAELLRRLHTGLSAEVDPATQRRFDDGHRFEAMARPLGEKIIGDDLAPVVGTQGELSASFDGLTLMGDTAWEHKTLNDELRACMKDQGNGYDLPKHYRVQMEQQLWVSGAERVLFMATKWDGDRLEEERHCWYASDPVLRSEIIAGWKQFAQDLATYTAPAAAPAVVAEPVQALPAVAVQVTGELVLRDNFRVFETALRDFLEHRLIREPKTDQDFADLDVQIKAMKGAEAALESAEAQMLAQIQSVDQAKKTKDMLAKLVRDNRLMAEKLLASEKERRRGEIVAGGIKAIQAHIDGLNTRLGHRYMPTVLADFAGCIKGLKSLSSMEDRVATELARLKIGANEIADKIDANLKHLRDHAADFKQLFPDTATIVLKAPEDLQSLVAARIAEHRAAEEKRLEAERERIRAEEQAKLQREQEAAARAERERQETEAREQRQREEQAAREEQQRQQVPAAAPTATVLPMPTKAPAAASAPTLRLGQINERLGFTVTADFLASLGFPMAAQDKAAKLWRESDWPAICLALVQRIQAAARQQEAA
jgi:putative phage-type endonuclease